MSFWGVIFVVLMILALVGGYYPNRANISNFGGFGLLWACVAILGYIVLAGGR